MKVMVNATTNVVGGGVQVAVAFVSQAMQDPLGCDFKFAVSNEVFDNLNESQQSDERIEKITPSPARLWIGRHSRRKLCQIEEQFQPDIVFTVFGPAYMQFKAKHLCGFADPWVTHRTPLAMHVLPLFQRFFVYLRSLYRQLSLSSNDYYWVEANVARNGLIRLLGIKPLQVKVIPNTYADLFRIAKDRQSYKKNNKRINVFCLAAPYPHKNLSIIPEVASKLRKNSSKIDYKFIVTLPDEGSEVNEVKKFWIKASKYGVLDMLENTGYLKLSECSKWYEKSDIVFLPTLLETFSATYLEAMVMGKPIVTSDLDFAHDVCAKAAMYYSPVSSGSASEAIRKVSEDQALAGELVKNGYERLNSFPSPKQKYSMLRDWIKEVYVME